MSQHDASAAIVLDDDEGAGLEYAALVIASVEDDEDDRPQQHDDHEDDADSSSDTSLRSYCGDASDSPVGSQGNSQIVVHDDERDDLQLLPFASPEDAEDSDVQFVGETFYAEASVGLPVGSFVCNSVPIGGGAKLRRDDTIELLDGDFLLIKSIFKDPRAKVFLKGLLLRRTRKVNNTLPKKRNEVAMIICVPHTLEDPVLEQCLVTRPLPAVVVLRSLICTNSLFPDHSWRQGTPWYNKGDEPNIETSGMLTCRWKYVEKFDDSRKKVVEFSWQALDRRECSSMCGRPGVDLRREWTKRDRRNKRTMTAAMSASAVVDLTSNDPVSSYIPEVIDLVHDEKGRGSSTHSAFRGPPRRVSRPDQTATQRPTTQHTYGDMGCGGGGTMRGAALAGLKPVFAVDYWSDAIETEKQNFPAEFGTKLFHKDFFGFCQGRDRSYLKVDVLHVSFPCQPHSPAHTVQGKDDDANIAAGYSVVPIFDKTRPRIATFEQTSGIVARNGGIHFRALVHQLTHVGFSVRARVINLADHGNVQERKRLIVIAACPGERLPTFPAPTHGDAPGLKRHVTIAHALRELRGRFIPHHMRTAGSKTGPRFDPDQPLKHCITTKGGESVVHFSGTRTWSLAELAVLQGFPWYHRFRGKYTSIRRQIGNAVPPVFAAKLFKHLDNHLHESDAEAAAWDDEVIDLSV